MQPELTKLTFLLTMTTNPSNEPSSASPTLQQQQQQQQSYSMRERDRAGPIGRVKPEDLDKIIAQARQKNIELEKAHAVCIIRKLKSLLLSLIILVYP